MTDTNSGISFEWVDGPDSKGPRPATRDEWNYIDEQCAQRGWMSLNRGLSRVLLAKRDEAIVGFHVMQAIPHAEPMWVAKEERGTGLAETLADKMVEFLVSINARGWVVTAGNPITEKICEDRGMFRVADAVYRTK